jgi:uncharacterized protein YbaA (DUF1428 family)
MDGELYRQNDAIKGEAEMSYIDGYVIAVPTANKTAYAAKAVTMAAMFKSHGASRMVETWEDDVPEGKLTSFPLAVKRAEGEAIVIGWIEWPSKEARDKGWENAMADPVMMSGDADLFDGKRMIYGGFQTLFDSGA